jgi:proteasome lid subunit RPN8/RPN11
MGADPEPRLSLTEIPLDNIGSAQLRRDVTMFAVAEQTIAEHVSANTAIEQGGALVGEVDEASGSVHISAAIPARLAVGTASSLTFTHDSWDEINDSLSRNFPKLRIVGWYHSHPDFGIFLSAYDTFIQQNFFSATWQVAYVIDPIRKQAGMFGWENGSIVSIPNWSAVGPSGDPTIRTNGHGVSARGHSATAHEPATRKVRRGWGDAIRMGFIALIIGLVGGYFIREATQPTPASAKTTTPSTTALTSGSLRPISVGSGVTIARSWAKVGDQFSLTVTVENTTGRPVVGSIENCAPEVSFTGAITSRACDFGITDPIFAHDARTFTFTLKSSRLGNQPWSSLDTPMFVSKGL